MFRWLGRTLARIEPRYGESGGAPAWPLRQLCMASKWLLMLPGCVIERISAKCFVSFASRGVQLADAHAGDGRGDRLVRAANLRRGVGLQVPGVEVARPAAQQDEDARLLGGSLRRLAAIHARRDDPRRGEAQGAGAAELKESAAGEGGVVHRVPRKA